MKKKYAEFYQPSEEQFQQLWRDSHFVFDANTLLNLYMYTEETVKDFFKVLDSIEDRIWISFHAGYEFHYNRPVRILAQLKLFDEILKSLKKISVDAQESLKTIFKSTREHPSINEEDILNKISEFFDSLIDNIERKKDTHPDWLEENDEILNRITDIFDGKTGVKILDDDLESIYKEGEVRYKKEIPPGFEDAKEKDEIKRYGDLIIWKEILRFAKNDNVKSIIFITDDGKKDWWRITSGKTIGPHPHLIKEFKESTEKDYYQYNSERFLMFAQQNLVDIREESISETKRVSHDLPLRATFLLDHKIYELMKEMRNPIPNMTQEQIDQVIGQARINELAKQVSSHIKPLSFINQGMIDQVTRQASMNELIRQLLQNESMIKHVDEIDQSTEDDSQEKKDDSEGV